VICKSPATRTAVTSPANIERDSKCSNARYDFRVIDMSPSNVPLNSLAMLSNALRIPDRGDAIDMPHDSLS
jgi:hypothetical protein